MTDLRQPSPIGLTLEEARAAIRNALDVSGRAPEVIVDFDETLWLRNTTEEYLSSLRPRLLAWAILLAIDAVRPWALLRQRGARLFYRDWVRTVACTALMPWSLMAWRRGAAERARRWQNRTLIEWLARDGRRPLKQAYDERPTLLRENYKELRRLYSVIGARLMRSGAFGQARMLLPAAFLPEACLRSVLGRC